MIDFWSRDRSIELPFEILKGATLSKIEVDKGNDTIVFHGNDGNIYCMLHEQDCCESVSIEDINGDLDDLVDSPILLAEMSTNRDTEKEYGSETWTFYKLATIKGYVDIRWYGSSNGYYSEEVNFKQLTKEGT